MLEGRGLQTYLNNEKHHFLVGFLLLWYMPWPKETGVGKGAFGWQVIVLIERSHGRSRKIWRWYAAYWLPLHGVLSFLMPPRATCPGMALPTVFGALLYQSIKGPHRLADVSIRWRQFLNWCLYQADKISLAQNSSMRLSSLINSRQGEQNEINI